MSVLITIKEIRGIDYYVKLVQIELGQECQTYGVTLSSRDVLQLPPLRQTGDGCGQRLTPLS